MFGGSAGYLRKGQWELRTSFNRFVSDKHYIGTERNRNIDAFKGPVNTRNQVNFDLTYALSSRWNLWLDVPVQFQTYDLHRVVKASGSTQPVPVNTGANGLGDISLHLGSWVFSPEHTNGNVFVSMGLQFPTGKADATSLVYGRQVPVDISVQPGNRAWAALPAVQAFRTFRRFSLYGFATYLINPRDTTGTPSFFSALNNPKTTNVNSSTDQYLAVIGGSAPTRLRWLTPTLAYQFSGVPAQDLFGPSDGFRRPAKLAYIVPGLQLNLLGQTINLSVPIVTHINVTPHIVNGVNQNTDATVPGFMLSLSYSWRFGGGGGGQANQ